MIDVLKNGFVIDLDEPYKDYETMEMVFSREIQLNIFGRLSEIDFLSRLYDLDDLPSYDNRFENASGDYWQHRINNEDWEDNWFFTDNRFNLKNGCGDEYLLKFICEVLHPIVREKDAPYKEYVSHLNEILKSDGYELVSVRSMSGREVYEAVEIDRVIIKYPFESMQTGLKLIGEGSYANVFKFKDNFYNKNFALKRAKKDLNEKELARFKREFEQMSNLSSPYIIDVFSYDETNNEYVMEYMDGTLDKYISTYNSTITLAERQGIILQLIKGYQYLHSTEAFHRDVSVKNVLYKKYDDVTVFKISDFGLVKIKDSDLTSENTKFKGSLNDPTLKTKGFKNYDLLDEIYALTLLFCIIMTGKSNYAVIKNTNIKTFLEQGTTANRAKRYQNLDELKAGVLNCISNLKER